MAFSHSFPKLFKLIVASLICSGLFSIITSQSSLAESTPSVSRPFVKQSTSPGVMLSPGGKARFFGGVTGIKFSDPSKDDPPLHAAIRKNDWVTAQKLIAAGADINGLKNQLQTPLLLAITLNHNDIARSLIAVGADVNLPDKAVTREYKNHSTTIPPQSPLSVAIQKQNEPLALFLLGKGATFNDIETSKTGPILSLKVNFKISPFCPHLYGRG